MNATCRPSGGPCRDETNALRNDPLIQQPWYNGWKRIDRMKWQKFDWRCGCNEHVFGPLSVRRYDLFSLSKFKLNDQLADLQQSEEFEFVAYGDSAYILLYLSHIHQGTS